jgi:hypothetical protein
MHATRLRRPSCDAEDGEPRFYGKFRGVVGVNIDPNDRARIMVHVPEVLGDSQAWALQCLHYSLPKEKPGVPPVEPECGLSSKRATRPAPYGAMWRGTYET